MGNIQCSHSSKPIIIGYYPIRAKAQVLRHICQYLHVNYKDLLLSPDQWEKYKESEARDWIIKDMPFIVDGNFVVTGMAGCVYYICEKSKRTDLFGRNIQDFMKVQNLKNKKDLLSAIIGMNCSLRSPCPVMQKQQISQCWKNKISPVLMKLDQEAKPNDFFLGYISILDFIIHEIMGTVKDSHPQQALRFPRLVAIQQKVGKIPEIEAYERSEKCIRDRCPKKYFEKFKKERSQAEDNTRSSNRSTNSMDVQ